MTKEMLFLAEIYTNWCKSQGLPDYMSADDLRYGQRHYRQTQFLPDELVRDFH